MEELNKFEIAKHVGRAEQTFSNIGSKGCVPITVAFTHGFDGEDYSHGLRPDTTIEEVKRAIVFIKSKHVEKVTEDEFMLPESDEKLTERISKTIGNSKTAWIVYYTEEGGHMIGLLRINKDRYSMCDVSKPDKYSKVSLQDVAKQIEEKHKQNNQKVYVFGFSDSQEKNV